MTLDEQGLKLLFLDARTHNGWKDEPVDDALLHRLYDTLRMAPTGANLSPARVLFVKSAAAKKRLEPALMPGNVEKTMQAPVTAVVAYDTDFAERADVLAPHRPKESFTGMPADRKEKLAVQSATMQAGYLILAARALGLDCGPMGGFDAAKVNEAFFAGTSWRTLLLVNLGHGDPDKLRPRAARLSFEQACRIE